MESLMNSSVVTTKEKCNTKPAEIALKNNSSEKEGDTFKKTVTVCCSLPLKKRRFTEMRCASQQQDQTTTAGSDIAGSATATDDTDNSQCREMPIVINPLKLSDSSFQMLPCQTWPGFNGNQFQQNVAKTCHSHAFCESDLDHWWKHYLSGVQMSNFQFRTNLCESFHYPDFTNIDLFNWQEPRVLGLHNATGIQPQSSLVYPRYSWQPEITDAYNSTFFLPSLADQWRSLCDADDDGDLPLHIAVIQGEEELTRKLIHVMLSLNLSLDTYNNLRQTPLHCATILKCEAIVGMLLESGASAGASNAKGCNSVHLAVLHETIDCLSVILRWSSLPDFSARNNDGFTPLHLAVRKGSMSAVTVLTNDLIGQQSIEVVDGKSGRTALFYAAENNDLPICELLIERNANVCATNYAGVTVVESANGCGNSEVAELLLKFGAEDVVDGCEFCSRELQSLERKKTSKKNLEGKMIQTSRKRSKKERMRKSSTRNMLSNVKGTTEKAKDDSATNDSKT